MQIESADVIAAVSTLNFLSLKDIAENGRHALFDKISMLPRVY